MSRVIPDEKTLALLGELSDRAEICNSQGAVIGYFQPISNQAAGDRYEPIVSKEELDRYEQEPGGRTLSEIMVDMLKHS